MKYSGRINRRYPAGFTRAARNRGIDADHFFSLLAPFFAIPGAFSLLEGMETYPIDPDERENKTRIAPNTRLTITTYRLKL